MANRGVVVAPGAPRAKLKSLATHLAFKRSLDIRFPGAPWHDLAAPEMIRDHRVQAIPLPALWACGEARGSGINSRNP